METKTFETKEPKLKHLNGQKVLVGRPLETELDMYLVTFEDRSQVCAYGKELK